MTLQWVGYVRSREKLNTLNLHLQRIHGHQTRQGADLQWQPFILKAILPFDHVTMWSHVKTWKIYISTITRLLASKLGRVLTYERRFRTQALKSSPTSFFTFIQSRFSEYCLISTEMKIIQQLVRVSTIVPRPQ